MAVTEEGHLEFNNEAWNELVRNVIKDTGVPRMQRVADACNQALESRERQNEPGYVVSVEGSKPLEEHDYRATVITKTNQAMVDNAENNTMLYNFHLASGDG